MKRFNIIFLFLLAINFLSSQDKIDRKAPFYLTEYNHYDKLYHDAGKLSLRNDYNERTEQQERDMNRQALNGFKKILPEIEKNRDDSLAFQCYFKLGTLEHYFDSLAAAQAFYQKAIALKTNLPRLADSFLFKPFLFSGSICYTLNQFDAALKSYKKAEDITEQYATPLEESNRLFNTLGALYYETGNYRQAKNYFEKAISIMHPGVPFYKELLVNYKINLASTLTKLEEYDEANTIYLNLLPLKVDRNEILHNIGTINLNLGASRAAIRYFRQVHYNNSKNVRLLNDIGLAYYNMNEPDSAKNYYEQALRENNKWNGKAKNVAHGLTLQYFGDWLMDKKKYEDAIEKYQQAILQFDEEFNETDIYKNPGQYSGVFSYINLFNTLTAKAKAFEKLYRQKNNIHFLEASLDAYRSAFRLADYVEKTYDSDEARLFLNKIKYTAHNKPIEIGILLYQLTRNKNFLEEVYLFDQQNKASILSLNAQENEIRKNSTGTKELYAEETSVRSAITRLALKASQITDSAQLHQLNASIRDYEIQLGKIREKINKDPLYREKEFKGRVPSLQQLQSILDNTTGVLSYHLSDSSLLLLVISSSGCEYYKTQINPGFFSQIDSFKSILHEISNEKKYNPAGLSFSLYKTLIEPAINSLSKFERLIIIPDDELNYLPFEALQDSSKKYLVQKFSVEYQYSTALLTTGEQSKKPMTSLAFAPFIKNSFRDTSGFSMDKLPSSEEEIKDLKGEILTDSFATKNNFIQKAGHFSIIHLATHAVADNESPLNSFIAFYPDKNNYNDYRLYAQEIYNMKLDSAQLIILSACETGTGQLIHGEGLMSLSRAFTYAGCPNIITSLWKAEDKSTAFIIQRLHLYLHKGFSKDKALQQAKLDLLKNPDLDPRFKTPNYWAHLIYIGNYETDRNSFEWWWILIAIVLIVSFFIYMQKKPDHR